MARTLPLDDSDALRAEERAGPWLFLLLQRNRPLAPSARYRLDVDRIVLGRGDRARTRTATSLAIAIDDPWMSTEHARIVREANGFVLEDAGSRNGTVRNGAAVTRATLHDGDVIEVGRTFLLYRDAIEAPPGHADERDETELVVATPGLATMSPAFGGELDRLVQLARSAVSMILIGASGTGKEVLARAIHTLSGRRGAFRGVNCAALPDTLVQSELFGHKKGAFSGAVDDRPGLVRSADGGTLLLDELGDLGPTGQGALLRVLQESEVTPIGAHQPVRVDVRVVAATHRDLATLAASDAFRSDLLARLSGFVFRVPPLCDRREDLGLLVRALLRALAPDPATISFSLEATRALLAHDWPLNIRELAKCLEAAVIQAADGTIQGRHLPEDVRAATFDEPAAAPVQDVRRDRLVALLREHGGNVSALARAMDTSRAQIRRWLRRYDLDPAAFR